MNSINLTDLIEAIMVAVGLAASIGQFPTLTNFAVRKGIEAATYHVYKPTHFFPRGYD